MKTGLLAIAVVLVGCVAGWASNRFEFANVLESYFEPELTEARQGGVVAEGPRVIVVNGEAHDFGTMEKNAKGSHEFVMKNVGDAPLTIEKGDTTCKCTVSDMTNGTVPPGGSVRITLSWNVADSAPDGEFRQLARFRTSDPQRPLIELMVHGFVDQSVRPVPPEVVINRISANEPSTATVSLMAYHSDSVDIVDHKFEKEATARFFQMDYRPMTAQEVATDSRARAGLLISIRILPGLPLGALEQVLSVTTNLPDQPPVQIPIKGSVISDISVVGGNFSTNRNLLNLGIVKQANGTKANLHVLIKGPHRDEVQLKVAATEPADVLQATLGEADRSNERIVRYPLTIEIPPGARQTSRLSSDAEQAASVTLETTHPQAKEVRILVRFAVEG